MDFVGVGGDTSVAGVSAGSIAVAGTSSVVGGRPVS